MGGRLDLEREMICDDGEIDNGKDDDDTDDGEGDKGSGRT